MEALTAVIEEFGAGGGEAGDSTLLSRGNSEGSSSSPAIIGGRKLTSLAQTCQMSSREGFILRGKVCFNMRNTLILLITGST